MMRRLRTIVIVISAMAFAVIGGVAIASALLPTPPSLVGQEASEPAGTSFVLGPVVADPSNGPDWTVRTYPSKTDWTCAETGRTDGKAFGRAAPDGAIIPLELPELGSCADVKESNFAIWVNHYPADGDREARAVIFGAVSDEVARVALTLDGSLKELPVTRGAFIDAQPKSALADGGVLTVTLANGSTHDTKLRPPPPPRTPTPPPAG
jgi:hypothetical protein